MSAPLEIDRSDWYLDEDEGMGEARLHGAIVRLLLTLIQDLAEQRGWTDCVIDSDQFISWVPSDPGIRVAPDIYLVRHAPADPWVGSWQTWKPGHNPPAFALEVVSKNWRKDYEQAPDKYADLGVEELVIFDPWPETRPHDRGLAFRHYLRHEGGFRRHLTAERAVLSSVLGVWIVAVPTEDGVRLRLAIPTKDDLLPTPIERERAEKERERAEKERERAEKERLAARLRALGIDPDTDQ